MASEFAIVAGIAQFFIIFNTVEFAEKNTEFHRIIMWTQIGKGILIALPIFD